VSTVHDKLAINIGNPQFLSEFYQSLHGITWTIRITMSPSELSNVPAVTPKANATIVTLGDPIEFDASTDTTGNRPRDSRVG